MLIAGAIAAFDCHRLQPLAAPVAAAGLPRCCYCCGSAAAAARAGWQVAVHLSAPAEAVGPPAAAAAAVSVISA